MKKVLIAVLSVCLVLFLSASVIAGKHNRQHRGHYRNHHVSKGTLFITGIIAGVIAGEAIGFNCADRHYRYLPRYRGPVVRLPYGHYETQSQRIWVPAQYRAVWNPGYYNRYGRLVPGHYQVITVHPGYFRTVYVKVWVSYRH